MAGLLVGSGREYECRVSSVLGRNVKEFGKKHLFDGREDTCWNSDQGSPQWVQVTLNGTPASVSGIRLTFQGGFAGKNCELLVSLSGKKEDFEKCSDFYPEDNNKSQTFTLPKAVEGSAFRVVFRDSSDFFGRVTVYELELISA